MKHIKEENEERLRKEYNKYLNSHVGQAYRCMSFDEWCYKRNMIGD